jgi:hypothetical protein
MQDGDEQSFQSVSKLDLNQNSTLPLCVKDQINKTGKSSLQLTSEPSAQAW